jgi:hypothetical protein
MTVGPQNGNGFVSPFWHIYFVVTPRYFFLGGGGGKWAPAIKHDAISFFIADAPREKSELTTIRRHVKLSHTAVTAWRQKEGQHANTTNH